MKKTVNLFLLLVLVLTFAACGGGSSEDTSTETPIVLAYSSLESTPLRSGVDESINQANNYYIFFHYYSEELVERLEANDEIIRKLQMHLSATGQSFQVSKKRYKQDGQIGEYLVLKLYDKNRGDNARTPLNRLAKKVGVNSVYLDLVSTAAKHFAGYFSPYSDELYLAAEYVDSLLIHNDIGTTARHELAHAMFENMRNRGVDSIYHSGFASTDGSDLVDFRTGYEQYISAEELYTFVSNMYWGVKADLDVLTGESREEFLDKVQAEIDSLYGIARQIYELSQETLFYLDYFPSSGMRFSNDLKIDSKRSNRFHFLYGDKTLISYSTDIAVINSAFDTLVDLANNAIRQGYNITAVELHQYPPRYKNQAQGLFRLIEQKEKAIFTALESNMLGLKKVSGFFISETEQLETKFLEIRSRFEENESDDQAVRDAFIELRTELRTFINKSREWHPSFAGLLD